MAFSHDIYEDFPRDCVLWKKWLILY
ncbi:uncharacterized protein FRV6_11701 [Fusarium oxysporum]|uniref:Uncharacterized protein n=1 Tax=Fusarium oxysporum TaxID=5507 RepID=A0A2H3TFU0_FUSOX|nr:uncharacterized protein FRV6_11701 [Fusarium oxysporum]